MRWTVAVAALCLLSNAALAAGQAEHYTVITGGNTVGHLVATREGDRVSIDYDVKNNGRGPTIAEQLTLGADGLPVAWTISGSTTFGSNVAVTWPPPSKSCKSSVRAGEKVGRRSRSACARRVVSRSSSAPSQ